MKKQFTEPTIEKVNFTLSDSTMCDGGSILSNGVHAESSSMGSMTGNQTGNQGH